MLINVVQAATKAKFRGNDGGGKGTANGSSSRAMRLAAADMTPQAAAREFTETPSFLGQVWGWGRRPLDSCHVHVAKCALSSHASTFYVCSLTGLRGIPVSCT